MVRHRRWKAKQRAEKLKKQVPFPDVPYGEDAKGAISQKEADEIVAKELSEKHNPFQRVENEHRLKKDDE